MDTPRPSPLAGMWYPADSQKLRLEIEHYLESATTRVDAGSVIGLLAPHAGYRFSGSVAAYAFRLLQGRELDTVVVIGPLHRPIAEVTGTVITSAHRAYQTPFGSITVDHDLINQINEQIPLAYCQFDSEHSVEIELPFLQVVLRSDFKLVPLMLRDQSLATAQQLSAALAELLVNRNALIVASSDLSHFYSDDQAQKLDRRVLQAVAHMDAASVIALDESGQGFACGRGAIATTILATSALGAGRSVILNHSTSGAINGQYSRVVGYGAAAFFHDA
ncbi:MAG: AmmeMemoRadiSam system protein B [Anaerolineae bacterium]|nr:AmmeMemoRadiSam system protein B [Anaerolineae bacterium]